MGAESKAARLQVAKDGSSRSRRSPAVDAGDSVLLGPESRSLRRTTGGPRRLRQAAAECVSWRPGQIAAHLESVTVGWRRSKSYLRPEA